MTLFLFFLFASVRVINFSSNRAYIQFLTYIDFFPLISTIVATLLHYSNTNFDYIFI